jgi:hypothetical protein
MKNYILFTLLVIFLYSCQFNTPTKQKSNETSDIEQKMTSMSAAVQQGVAKEIQQTGNYTYLLINSGNSDFWIAVPRMEASVGTKYYFIENMKMENFHSKELNKSFETILFVQKISTNPAAFEEPKKDQTLNMPKTEITKQNITIEPIKGVTSIAELYSNKKMYEGKMVSVKGVVTKYNAQIMGKNWIHLQDGTEKDGKFDLTIATKEIAKLGETIILTGKLSVDKDFGYGYKYEIILEDAVIK